RGFMLVKDEKGRLEVARHRGLQRSELPPALSTSILAEAERTGEPVFAADAQSARRVGEGQRGLGLGLRSAGGGRVVGGGGGGADPPGGDRGGPEGAAP